MRFGLFGKRDRPADSGPAVLEDPYFGTVTRAATGLWTCRKPFAPTGTVVELGLQAGTYGPSERQREFFRQAVERYPALVEQYRARLVGDGKPFTDGSSPQALFDSLVLEFVLLPEIGDAPVQWEMTYTSPLEDHIISLAFTDWRLDEDRWDG